MGEERVETPPRMMISGGFTRTNEYTFNSKDGKEVGSLIIEEGMLRFEGNAEESARVFFDHLIEFHRKWIQD